MASETVNSKTAPGPKQTKPSLPTGTPSKDAQPKKNSRTGETPNDSDLQSRNKALADMEPSDVAGSCTVDELWKNAMTCITGEK